MNICTFAPQTEGGVLMAVWRSAMSVLRHVRYNLRMVRQRLKPIGRIELDGGLYMDHVRVRELIRLRPFSLSLLNWLLVTALCRKRVAFALRNTEGILLSARFYYFNVEEVNSADAIHASYHYANPKFRGKGYGNISFTESERYIDVTARVSAYRAWVLESNVPSMRCCIGHGYAELYRKCIGGEEFDCYIGRSIKR